MRRGIPFRRVVVVYVAHVVGGLGVRGKRLRLNVRVCLPWHAAFLCHSLLFHKAKHIRFMLRLHTVLRRWRVGPWVKRHHWRYWITHGRRGRRTKLRRTSRRWRRLAR